MHFQSYARLNEFNQTVGHSLFQMLWKSKREILIMPCFYGVATFPWDAKCHVFIKKQFHIDGMLNAMFSQKCNSISMGGQMRLSFGATEYHGVCVGGSCHCWAGLWHVNLGKYAYVIAKLSAWWVSWPIAKGAKPLSRAWLSDDCVTIV